MKIITKTKKLNFRTKPIGATAVEYMIMLILIAMFIIGIMRVFGDTISNKVARANGGIETMSDNSASGSGSGNGVGGEAGVGGAAGKGKGKGGSGNGNKSGSASKGSGNASGNGSGNNSGSGGNNGNGSKSGSGNSGLKGGKKMANGSGGGGGEEEEEKSGPGINPIVLLIAMGLLGLLIYVMTANKKGS